MKEYRIVKIRDKNWYTLESEEGREYEIGIDFYDIEPLPQEGEYIRLSEKLFDIKANEGIRHFRFGGLSEIYGRNIKKKDYDTSDEIFMIMRNGNKTYLKRWYG